MRRIASRKLAQLVVSLATLARPSRPLRGALRHEVV
jgi:hypothetical protein